MRRGRVTTAAVHRLRVLGALACLAGVLCLFGCARYVPAAELDASGAEVGVVVRFSGGAAVSGQLLALDGDKARVELIYVLGGETDLRGTGDRRRLIVDGGDVPGEVVAVEREGIRTVVRLHRSVRLDEMEEMTFHRSGREASLGPLVSAVLGPAIGALLALSI